jgi:dTDP-4-dehydrorhamnose 3,5-epimerase
MKFIETNLKGCYTIENDVYEDSRGCFFRTYCAKEFEAIGFKESWVQHNHSYTAISGSIRGLHYQRAPAGEHKLIRCITGKVFDVAVDLRPQSPTYLKWHAEELSANNKKMIFIPKGFAHGFQTLTDDAELLYCHSEMYQPNYEAGINFRDKQIDINWPLKVTEISDKDQNQPFINQNFKGINI